ncbi:YopT-type cysteine protease domain-containing protein [Roseococcus sp. SYP-B2431]|uniref:YopT-type cysteine protease domain-containing protein n=1 Tax=Roseococcus sp. SYP-B2431 TaxID=2496640 RepID=UPI0013F43971|nr:YopT-type cysteine protease domain-containing protein [Roseococcus sp. SYP-B2431]
METPAMAMNHLQAGADKSGFLVYALEQAKTAPLAVPGPWGPIHAGYCAGLAVRWIALRYALMDYKFDRATKICEAPDWQSTRDQNIVIDEWQDISKPVPMRFRAAFAKYSLHVNQGATIDQPMAMNGVMLRHVGQAEKGCHCIYIEGTGGAHAVAMQREDSPAGAWRFFDANFGHFRLPSAQAFESFINWFMATSGYNQSFANRVSTVHISPPPYTGAAFGRGMAVLTNSLKR